MDFKFLISILFIFLFLFIPNQVFAGDPPQLSSPSDGSTTSSSKLEWQAPSYPLYSGNNYRVQVDDDSSFSSLNKDYYTDNVYYTPTLTDGVWYWRVKAKDSSATWSFWSSVWSFTLTVSFPTPSPSPSDNPSPTPASTPTPQPVSSPASSSFLISNIPSQINSDQAFNVSVQLSLPNNPNTPFYLKGAFKKGDSSNYFGQTLVSGSWVKNGSSYSSQYPITTDSSGNWANQIEVKVDSEDSGFAGSGDYIFKIGRYTSSGSGPTWSNEVNINITAINTEKAIDQGSTSVSTSSKNTPKPASTPSKKATSNTSSIISLSKSPQQKIASVAGIQSSPTAAPSVEVLSKKQTNLIPWLGGGFIFAGLSSLGLIYLKHKGLYEKLFKQIR